MPIPNDLDKQLYQFRNAFNYFSTFLRSVVEASLGNGNTQVCVNCSVFSPAENGESDTAEYLRRDILFEKSRMVSGYTSLSGRHIRRYVLDT